MKKLICALVVVLVLVMVVTTWLLSPDSKSSRRQIVSENPPAPPTTSLAAVDTNAPTFAAWVHNIQAAPAPTSAQLEEGIRLAEARRTEMLQLIRENPQRALEQSLKWSEWAALPQEIRALVEQPFSETVEFSMVPDCRPNDSRTTPWQTHRIKMNGEWLDAFVYGRREHASSKNGLLAQGIQLGNQVALWDRAVLPLEGAELAASQNILPDGNNRTQSWLTGQSIQGAPVAALVGGKIHYFASAEEMHEVATAIAAAETQPGPHNVIRAMASATGANGPFNIAKFELEARTANSVWTETPKRVLVMRVDFTPGSGNPYTTAALAADFLVVSNSLREMSFNKTWLTYDIVPSLITITNPQSFWETNSSGADGIMDASKAIAQTMGYTNTNYDIFVVSMPYMQRYFTAAAFAGGQNQWINGGAYNADIPVHEFGHNYGYGHANYWHGSTGAGLLGHTNGSGGTLEHWEYGDPFDRMGSGPGGDSVIQDHFSMLAKAHLNWIEPNEVINVSTSGVYRIRRFDHINARQLAGGTLALCVTNSAGDEFWVGYRRAITNASHSLTTNSAYVIWASPDHSWHRLMQTTPLSMPNGSLDQERINSLLPPGQAWADPSGSVRITTLGAGGTSPNEYLDVVVDVNAAPSPYRLFTTQAATTLGLIGSYVNTSLRGRTNQEDWTAVAGVTISGTRIDRVNFQTASWGHRSTVGLTGGSDLDWENFSVQWDGWLQVDRPSKFALRSDDGSRMWIDVDGNNVFSPTIEFFDNGWGTGHSSAVGQITPTLLPGLYRIRIQYEETNGENVCELVASPAEFDLYTGVSLGIPGLVGNYVNSNLRSYAPQDDWRLTQTISGTRQDVFPFFQNNPPNAANWGNRTNVGITGGTADNWDNFSVQWDGWIRVYVPTRLATVGDDSSRMWIDLNGDAAFATTAPEFVNNHWGTGQTDIFGENSAVINPGAYRIRIQYEEGVGGNHFGLLGDPAETAVGPSGYALQFDGTNYVEVPNVGLSMPTNEITIEFWQRVYEVRNQLTFSMSPDFPTNRIAAHVPWGDSAVYWDFGNYLGAGRLAYVPTNSLVGTWNHFALVSSRSGPYQRIYRNGVLEASDNTSMTFLRYAAAFRMGGYYAGQYFKGELENFRIWSVARTQAEIQQFMYSANVGASPNLWADWRFDDGGGITVTDYSGNGRHGTIVNGAQWVASSIPQLSTAPKIEVFTGATTDPAFKRENGVGIHTFAGTLIGNSSVTQTFTIKNTGWANLGLALIKTGVNTNDFNVSALGTTILTTDLTTTFTVSFTPSTNGFRTATINVTSNDENNDPFSIILGGVGLQTLPIVDASAPGDVTQASSPNFPAAEDPSKAIDNDVTSKYLNFDELNTGMTIKPSGQQPVRALTLISANDAPERDPSSFVLEGSNDGSTFTRITSNAVPAFPARHSIRSFPVTNTNVFSHYRVVFPTIANPVTANSMQIAEVELLYWPELTSTNDTRSITLPPGASDVQGFASLFDRQLDGPRKLEVAPIAGGNTIVNITLALGAKVLKGFELIGAADDFSFPGRRPSSVTVAGSSDGVNYANLATVVPVAPSSNLQIQEFATTSNTIAYPRYRIVFGPPVSGDRLQVGEMRLFGESAPTVVIPPLLAIQASGNNVSISWTNEPGFILESKTTLPAGAWTSVGIAPVLSNGVNTVTLPMIEESSFFRLRK